MNKLGDYNEMKWNESIYFLINKLQFTGFIVHYLQGCYDFTVVNADQKGDHSNSLRLVKESGHLYYIFIYMCFVFLFIYLFFNFICRF